MILLKICLFLTIISLVLGIINITNKKEGYLPPALAFCATSSNPYCIGTPIRDSQELAEKQRQTSLEEDKRKRERERQN